jgi:ABC-2 type transport system permease protein
MRWLPVFKKEMRLYFGSPVAYVVFTFFLLISGWFFSQIFLFYSDASMRSFMQPQFGQNLNVIENVMRPLFTNMSVVLLFFIPMLTMRLFAEEKRSGTIELLLTAPLTDFQIIMGKFLGAMGLFAAMMAVTLPHVAILFAYGNPEWKPIVTGYLGLLLFGGCFVSLGLFISSLTTNQIVAAVVTFSVFLMLWVINWLGSFSTGWVADVTNYLSITDQLDDFTKGVIDTSHLIYYVSFITFGLFLTAKAVDTERWRG